LEAHLNEPKKGASRRSFLKKTAVAAGAAAALGAGVYLGSVRRVSRAAGKKVIILGIDGMDPRLSEAMMNENELPNLARLRRAGGFNPLGTSTPPQSPVAWANFINGAGPGSHGIFDFLHRHPDNIAVPFSSFAETLPGEGGWDIGDHRIPLDFWPFNHKPPSTVSRRQGTPFWDYLDEAGVPSTFYDLPSNYPASPSKCGHHRCICGMGTPDLFGGYGTYQYFAEDGPEETLTEMGGMRSQAKFEGETAKIEIIGPKNSMLRDPQDIKLELLIHRDRAANAAVLQIQDRRIILRPGEWSQWTQLDFTMTAPWFLPNTKISGICRFYLRALTPNLQLYVSPININPAAPAVPISEPPSFIQDVSRRLGLFPTAGFQEDYNTLKNGLFDGGEYRRQANMVLDDRLRLWEQALADYDDGLLFFYFSSSDLQSHMFWWTPGEEHPTRSQAEAAQYHGYVRSLYQRLDRVVGDLFDRYGASATIIVMSDHGFANFGRQFNLNSWLRDHGYLNPSNCTSVRTDADWSQTTAYGMGINGLYLNLKGREKDGNVEPGDADALKEELIRRLQAVRDFDDKPVIRGVYRADRIYSGPATEFAPDLIVGYHRGYRASWATTLGDLEEDVISVNDNAWSADHCADALEVPGVLWSNRPIVGENPSLVDLAPSILAYYGLAKPAQMVGRNILGDR
jgi:predicted AlkP superfamily phosphohydrolase/phosphomutase